MSRTRKRWIVAAVAVVAVAAVAFAARGRSSGETEQEKGPDVPTIASKIADVQVVVREIGTVEPEVKVDVKSTLSGRIVSLPVRAGDVVRRGDLIARIEPDVNQAQNLLAVKSTVESSSIDLEDARSDYDAKRQLFERGLISVEIHREAETRLRQAEQEAASAREKQRLVEASGIPVGDNPQQVVNITSPMDGVVIHRPVELGETVTGSGSFNAGTVIATVADLATLLVEAGVNEVDIGKIHEGQEVSVTLDAFPRVRFPGAIERIAPAARLDEQVKVFDVDIRLEHLGHQLRTGMTANIEIRGETREGVLTVPVEAVFVRGDEEVVYVERSEPLPAEPGTATADDGTAEAAAAPWKDDPRQEWRRWFEERPVVTGIASTTDVEIVEGLADGDKVALADPSRPPEQGAVS
jgi:HlyD family secretion protein